MSEPADREARLAAWLEAQVVAFLEAGGGDVEQFARRAGASDADAAAALLARLRALGRAQDAFAGLGARRPFAVGMRVGGFEITRVLGRGGMGQVFEARQLGLGRLVALKVPHWFHDEATRDRQRREAEAVARLAHPGLVPLHEVREHDGTVFLVMERVHGESLHAILVRLRDAPTLPRDGAAFGRPGVPYPRAVAELLADALDAIEFAHEHGVFHRDLKPGNLLIEPSGRVRIVDFGLARVADASGVTRTADLLGTPSYVSPEQVDDARAAGPWTDVYSAGVVLYELLTLALPFAADTTGALLWKIKAGDHRPARLVRRELPRNLSAIAEKAMALSPLDRYPRAAAFAADLRRWLAGRPVEARPSSAVERLWRRARRRPDLLGTAAAAIVVVAGLFGWQWTAAAEERVRRVAAWQTDLQQIRDLTERRQFVLAAELAERLVREAEGVVARRAAESERGRAELLGTVERSEVGSRMTDAESDPAGFARVVDRHRALLAARGIRLDADSEADARVAEATGYADAIVVTLDLLAHAVFMAGGDQELFRRVVALANALDRPDNARARQGLLGEDSPSHANRVVAESRVGALTPELLALAGRFVQSKDDSAARALLRSACEAHADDFWLRVELAYVEVPDRVVAAWLDALVLRGRSAFVWNNLGLALADRGRLDAGVWCLEHAVELDPEIAGFVHNLGLTLLRAGRHADAAAAFERAIERTEPGSTARANAHAERGRSFAEAGDAARGLAEFERALAIEPTRPAFLQNAAVANERLGRFGVAVGHWRAFAATEHGRSLGAGQFRLQAGESGILAGTGFVADVPLDDRPELALQGIAWLAEELGLLEAFAARGAEQRSAVRSALPRWQAGRAWRWIDEPEILAAQPDAVRDAWLELRVRVLALARRLR